jgi:hypothetical protein
MQIIPKVGDHVVTASSVEVQINPEDRAEAEALVKRSKEFKYVSGDDMTFEDATAMAGELKAMLDRIQNAKKMAKAPFTAVEKAIDNLANNVSSPVKKEQERLLGLLAGHVAKLKAAREAEERRQAEARVLAQAEADRKVWEAQKQALLAQEQLRKAQGEIEQARHREELQRRESQLLQEQLARSLAIDVEELGVSDERPKGLIPGGRVTNDYTFELINVQQTCEARCYRLLRWELDILACKDAVRNLVEMNPNVEPTLPGIKITKKLSVSVGAAARIK